MDKKLPASKLTKGYKYWLILIIVGLIFLIAGLSVETETEVKTDLYGQTEKVMNLQGTIQNAVFTSFGAAMASVGLVLFLQGKEKVKVENYLYDAYKNT